MSRVWGRVALAGLLSVVSVSAIHAQQAGAPEAASAEPPCSGFICAFGAREAQPPQTAATATQPAATPAAGPIVANADPVVATAKPRARPARVIHPILIAADASEIARLKGLATVMPKEKIKIVKTTDGGADFTVSTTLDARGGPEKARLFTEQMHIIAGGAIHSVADLEGKVVSFGADKGSSQAAGRKAFETLGVHVEETPLEFDNALDGLATGDVDAVVVLAPQPDERLKHLVAPGLHLVAWPENGALPDGAVTASIDGGRYPGIAKPGEMIRALGVDAILTLSPKGARQLAAKAFLSALAQRSALLSKRGFDLLKADLESRAGRRVASVDRR